MNYNYNLILNFIIHGILEKREYCTYVLFITFEYLNQIVGKSTPWIGKHLFRATSVKIQWSSKSVGLRRSERLGIFRKRTVQIKTHISQFRRYDEHLFGSSKNVLSVRENQQFSCF